MHRAQGHGLYVGRADANGVTVALCLPMKAERHGFDYDDEEAVAAQLAYARGEVLKYKDHPALLFWIIGNELNHDYENPRVYDAVNDVAEMIRELDPYHPTTTTTSGFKPDVNAEILARAPALDFISFQVYGQLFILPEFLEETGTTEAVEKVEIRARVTGFLRISARFARWNACSNSIHSSQASSSPDARNARCAPQARCARLLSSANTS